ncbi:NADH:flavin oxidoreductase / NADH oxidase family protein [Paraburkholderia aspalathi]|uniref:NADH:flavin oxidoreductase / NADH oxidase family protein n=1 Tax=Paraburkholderia aspalathi TaxID=1324617 RepID=A0A1I7ER01_9BURK|nr:NADH:flavin oxidoreductase / NADH oxidase family protein [Paraburkholderia aspalathi]
MGVLFTPATLKALTLSDRIVVSPMCEYRAVDGRASSWHFAHLGGLAQSGAGMMIIEATAVEPEGHITPGCLGLWDDETEAALKPVVPAIRANSSIAPAMQISHAGRKASSEVPWKGGSLSASNRAAGLRMDRRLCRKRRARRRLRRLMVLA